MQNATKGESNMYNSVYSSAVQFANVAGAHFRCTSQHLRGNSLEGTSLWRPFGDRRAHSPFPETS